MFYGDRIGQLNLNNLSVLLIEGTRAYSPLRNGVEATIVWGAYGRVSEARYWPKPTSSSGVMSAVRGAVERTGDRISRSD